MKHLRLDLYSDKKKMTQTTFEFIKISHYYNRTIRINKK